MGDEIMTQAGCILGERQSHRHLDRAFPSSLDALTVTDPSLYRGSVVSHPKFLPTAQPGTSMSNRGDNEGKPSLGLVTVAPSAGQINPSVTSQLPPS